MYVQVAHYGLVTLDELAEMLTDVIWVVLQRE